MVAGYVAALGVMATERRGIERFVAEVCRKDGLDPYRQLVILVGFRSNVGEQLAMEIAGPAWLDRQGGARITDGNTRREAEAIWRGGATAPTSWPYRILGRSSHAVWLVPFADLPPHLMRLWDDATWLVDGHWESDTPERPDGSMPWLVSVAGDWRAWMPTPAPRWSLRALLGRG
jgi:hypothetical protein